MRCVQPQMRLLPRATDIGVQHVAYYLGARYIPSKPKTGQNIH